MARFNDLIYNLYVIIIVSYNNFEFRWIYFIKIIYSPFV